MKIISLIIFLSISVSSYSQYGSLDDGFSGKETRVYKFKKSEYYSKEFKFPGYSGKYSIFFEKDGYWEFLGELKSTQIPYNAPGLSFRTATLFFKSGYRVAYSVDGKEPVEIKFEEKKWKVK